MGSQPPPGPQGARSALEIFVELGGFRDPALANPFLNPTPEATKRKKETELVEKRALAARAMRIN